jgi:pimeloyl-ACP methyl ester carboxylesterase
MVLVRMTALVIIVVVLIAGAVATLVLARLIERRHPPQGRFIEVHGLRRHVVELGKAGDTSSVPVVLLHGAGANLKDMELAVADRLAARHRVILIDRPGFGFSARKKGAENSPTEQAIVLDELFNTLGIDRAIIVGHSWGGTLALTFALDYPQRVAGLVLIAPPTHPRLRGFGRYNAIFATPLGWLFAHTLALPLGALLIELGIRAAFLPQSTPSAYSKRSAAWLILRPRSLMANWAEIGALDPFLRKQIDRYPALRAPTIMLSGDRDPLVPPQEHAAKVAEVAPVAKVEVLKGFGHMLHHAAADRIAAAVEELSQGLQAVGESAQAPAD